MAENYLFSVTVKERQYDLTCSLDEDADVIVEKLLKPVCPAYTSDYIGIRAVALAQIQRAQLRLARQRINELLDSQERTIKYFVDTSLQGRRQEEPPEAEEDDDENSNKKTWREVLSPQSQQNQLLLHPQNQRSKNRYHDLLTFPLSEVVENRIITR
jgi:hypothetical protein